MYALIDISSQMLEDSAFDHAGASLRHGKGNGESKGKGKSEGKGKGKGDP